MILRFLPDLSKLDISANGAELASIMGVDQDEQGKRVYTWPESRQVFVHTFQNPVLVTDNHKISQLEPAIRDTVFALYNSFTPKITEYDGVRLKFEQRKYPGVWGPSIDTLLFCKALSQLDLSKVKTAVDIGCGSGMISKYVLEKAAPNLESITLVDINPVAGECIKENIKDARAEFKAIDGIKFLSQDKQYDLVLCNPPYIRRPRSIEDNSYEGIGLLVHLIKETPRIVTPQGSLVTNISSLSGSIAQEAIAQAAVIDKVIESMQVPLKVYNVLNNKEWMDYLLAHGLEKNRRNGYDYWQQINIHQIQPTPAKRGTE